MIVSLTRKGALPKNTLFVDCPSYPPPLSLILIELLTLTSLQTTFIMFIATKKHAIFKHFVTKRDIRD